MNIIIGEKSGRRSLFVRFLQFPISKVFIRDTSTNEDVRRVGFDPSMR